MTEVVLATLALYLLQLMLPNLMLLHAVKSKPHPYSGDATKLSKNRLSSGVPTALPSIYKKA